MHESRVCICAISQQKSFYAQISFLFFFFFSFRIYQKIVDILVSDLGYSLNCVFFIIFLWTLKTNFCQNVCYDLLEFTWRNDTDMLFIHLQVWCSFWPFFPRLVRLTYPLKHIIGLRTKGTQTDINVVWALIHFIWYTIYKKTISIFCHHLWLSKECCYQNICLNKKVEIFK